MGNSNGKYVLTEDDIKWFTKHTMITEQDVRNRYEQFVKMHPLGKIGKNDYTNLLKDCYGKNIEYKGLEKYIFETYDRNGDGWVDFSEFLKVLYILSNSPPKEKLELLFRVFDSDQNGYISSHEVKVMMTDFFHLLGKVQVHFGIIH